MKAIILDGFYAGLILDHDGNPNLTLMVPKKIIDCDCNPEVDDIMEVGPKRLDYKMAARGYDGSAVYSLSGDLFKPMTEGRDWVVDKRKSPFYKQKHIYLHCRDDGAFD